MWNKIFLIRLSQLRPRDPQPSSVHGKFNLNFIHLVKLRCILMQSPKIEQFTTKNSPKSFIQLTFLCKQITCRLNCTLNPWLRFQPPGEKAGMRWMDTCFGCYQILAGGREKKKPNSGTFISDQCLQGRFELVLIAKSVDRLFCNNPIENNEMFSLNVDVSSCY